MTSDRPYYQKIELRSQNAVNLNKILHYIKIIAQQNEMEIHSEEFGMVSQEQLDDEVEE